MTFSGDFAEAPPTACPCRPNPDGTSSGAPPHAVPRAFLDDALRPERVTQGAHVIVGSGLVRAVALSGCEQIGILRVLRARPTPAP